MFYWYGVEFDHRILVIQILGKSLEALMQDQGGKLSLKTVCMLAIQCITRLELFHEKSFLHRDIKPENFLMHNSNVQTEQVCYIIDYGLSKRYIDRKSGEHIP